MHRGGNTLLVGASLALVACTTAQPNVQVRAIADPAAKLGRGGSDLDRARAYLALGSVGLALEGFRKVQRDNPTSAEAIAGIAACYQAMGRYDLAQQNYEAALALAPQDPSLLTALAAVFDREAKSFEAAQTRADAARILAARRALSAPLAKAQTKAAPAAVFTETPKQAMATVVAAQPKQAQGTVAAATLVAAAQPKPASSLRSPNLRALTPVNIESKAPHGNVPTAMAAISLPAMAIPQPAPASSITIALPPPRPVSAPRPQPRSSPVEVLDAQVASPRLERLSRGEVALVTTGKPIWQAQLVARTRLSTTVRWVPVQSASVRPNVQILNAARRQGIAAQARNTLLDRGWRRIAIGDAPATRSTSVVMYPAERAALGRSLAAQFGFRAQLVRETDVLVVLLGLDAGARSAAVRG